MILTREYKETWNSFEKIGFRFFFVYFCFYSLSLFASSIFKPIVYWAAKNIFSVAYDFSTRGYGSGDTTYQYILLFVVASLSVIISIAWSLIDKRKSYNQLAYGFSLLLRLVLVFYLFIYGFIKVFHMQMIPPTYSQLLTNLGEMSPMRLAWIFMGYSKAYSIFAGASEVIAGLLLISRRTQTIGSLVVVAVMGNVFMMNMAFDIPVKIFSFHLLLMGVVLFLYDSKRFINAIILQKKVKKSIPYPVLSAEGRKILRIVKVFVTLLAVVIFTLIGYNRSNSFHELMNPTFKGAWKIISFEKNGVTLPPLTTDSYRWDYLIIDRKDYATVLKMNKEKESFSFEVDTVGKNLIIKEQSSNIENKLSYTKQDNYIKAKGLFLNDTLTIEMVRKSDKDFYLKARGFHWINESPNNK